jgi:chromosome partitioning protein
MCKVYAVSINKGGVGKTSLVTNLSAALVRGYKKKVLIIDTDGQGNTSMAFGLDPESYEYTVYDVLVKGTPATNAIVEINDHLHILPANSEMNFIDFDVLTNMGKYPQPFGLLRDTINNLKSSYDYIFIDTPPSLSLVAGNVLSVADRVIIPFVPETFAVNGLIRVLEVIEDFKNKENPNLQIAGIVGMMADLRTSLHSGMLQEARKYCLANGLHMFETIIPKSIRFANSTAYEGKPATWTDYNNTIVAAYYELLKEVIKHGEEK